MTLNKQVDAAVHYQRRYLTLPRIITHWYQANEVAEETPPGGALLHQFSSPECRFRSVCASMCAPPLD